MPPMLLVLPGLCFVLIVINLVSRRGPGTDIRAVFLSAAVIWGVALAGITEILSLFHALTAGPLAASWTILTAVSAALLTTTSGTVPRFAFRSPGILALAMALPIATIVLGTTLIAALGWPSQWDSMVYHLSRVDHWIQNRTVDFYPTHIIRQLYNPPGAEYAILHFRVLGGDERWSNAPQWLSMIGSLIGVSLIAQQLGAPPGGQLFSSLFAATIPMGILQAPGTQNDYVPAFWLVCMTHGALSSPSAARSFQVGASLGLALLSKTTAFVFAGPLLLVMPKLIRGPWRLQLRQGAWIVLILGALNLAHWVRNIGTFGMPLGPASSDSAGGIRDKLTNDALSLDILASNVARNISLHLGTPFEPVNLALEETLVRGHAWLGLAVDDPRSTRLYSAPRFAVVGEFANPDRTGNPLHLLLILVTCARIALLGPLRSSPGLARYGVALAIAFVLFCLVLKWQPWHSRLHLPLFVLAAPLVGVVWAGVRQMMWVATVLLGTLAAYPLLGNRLAPLMGAHTVLNTPRLHQQFQSFSRGPSRRERVYVAAAEVVDRAGCANVGLLVDWDDWEHPLWVLLSHPQRPTRRIEHVGVTNASARLWKSRPIFVPCAIVGRSVPGRGSIDLEGRSYSLYRQGDGLNVFLADGHAPRKP
jgi:hypothetical protein